MKKEKKNYEAPKLTLDADLHLFEWNNSDPHVTQYNEDDSWAGYSWN